MNVESTTAEVCEQLNDVGYAIVENVLGDQTVAELRSELLELLGPTGRNDFEGFGTQRAYGVMARSTACDPLVEHPLVLGVLDQFLEVNYLISQLVAINIQPDESAQDLHYDDALYPVPRPRAPISVATMWAFDDFTEANGGTRILPASHTWGDRQPTDDEIAQSIAATMPAGSVLFFLGTLWHGGGANASTGSRLGVTAQYCAPWARTVENFGLSMPRERVAATSERMQNLLGYNIHLNLMGYVDGRHPRRLLGPNG